MKIGDVLITWYRKHKRDLPWRKTRDPYFIWVSEIVLQQTRISQGTSYYQRFIKKFPNIYSLANANLDEVLKVWQGLGYYSRARNMYETANNIVNEKNGIFPTNSCELKQLKGIGEYTAAAIASISYNEKIPVVDGNVLRWIARLNGYDAPLSSVKLKDEVYQKCVEYMLHSNPGEFNQAMMEFGALQCKPGKPECSTCPFSEICKAHIHHLEEKIPTKNKVNKQKTRYFHYFILKYKGKVVLKKRTEDDIWKGLYEFPMIETKRKTSFKTILETKDAKKMFITKFKSCREIGKEVRHLLSHQIILARFFELTFSETPKFNIQNADIVQIASINKYPVSKIIEKIIEMELKN
jgi:A/G-specific adenine glycosylase